MKLITDTDYCPVRNFDNVCSLCNCECISGEALTLDCPLIRNGGTPLPKGHGRLIDADKLDTRERGNNSQRTMWWNIERIVDKAPTIVEADKENDNE